LDNAEDLLLEVFLVALEHEKDLAAIPVDEQRAWLWTVARNKVIDSARHQRRHQHSEQNQMLLSINAVNGKVQWSRRLPHHVIPEIAPVVSGNTIYLSTSGDQLDMFRATDGSIVSSFVVGDNASSTDKYIYLTITQ